MRRIVRLLIAAAACLAVLAPATASADPYISMGDSSSTTGTYVTSLYNGFGDSFMGYDEELGATEHVSLAQAGAGLFGFVQGQVPAALARIGDPDDTKALTVGIGGNDALGGCFTPTSECGPFRQNLTNSLSQLKSALADDPGEEPFIILAFFNPKNETVDEADFDQRLLGPNLIADQCPGTTTAGLNDVIFQVGSDLGISVGDAYPAFKANGAAYIGGDGIHPNAAGNLAIAEAFLAPVAPTDCPDPPDPTCETDQTLCPPGPTCETDQSLCPPDPTCETDASLCPPPKDTKRPRTKFTKVKIGRRSVKFRFESSEKGSTFKCALDGRRFRRCKSPKKLKGLKKGKHIFRVRAIDASGNVDKSPAKRKFRIRR
ncbi:MAG: SGNH/GDSL hydrolase family protein [Solirubrobacterales bacterium]|nr:SGNH/GDSL hydrolase family protein [Solirubrobacterales bacterium]